MQKFSSYLTAVVYAQYFMCGLDLPCFRCIFLHILNELAQASVMNCILTRKTEFFGFACQIDDLTMKGIAVAVGFLN